MTYNDKRWVSRFVPRRRAGARIALVGCLCALGVIVPTLGGVGTDAAKDGAANPVPPPAAVDKTASDSTVVDKAEPAARPLVKIGPDQRVTMHVAGLPVQDALRLLCEPIHRNVVLANGVSGSVTVNLYDVPFEDAIQAVLESNGLGYRQEGEFIYVHTQDNLNKLEQSRRSLETRVFQLSYLNAAAAKQLIEPLLTAGVGLIALTPPAKAGLGGGDSGGGGGASGGGGGASEGGGSTDGDAVANTDLLVVTDYAEKLDAMSQIIKEIDVRPKQVLIEATILRATLSEDNSLGIDFTTVGGIDFSSLESVSPAAQRITTGNTPTAALNDTTFTARTEFNGALPGGGFTFGIIKDQIGVFLRALEQITDADVLANPKLLALNKQLGQVIVGRRDGYLTTTITETTAVQTVEFLETGTILSFRPFVGDDGTIRMEIHPKDSTGGLTASNLPFEQTTEVTTNILMRDGQTILIGGLFREVDTATRGQVPLLGNVPGLGALFRSTRDTTTREEVIILLTVHVVKGEPDVIASEELRDDVERLRVGMRRGMQWFARERLAQVHYRWAMEHLARGDTDKALWDARLAMHNYPRHVPAIRLAESLARKRFWESESSQIRTFVQDRIAEEKGILKPPFGRPSPAIVMPESLDAPMGPEPAERKPERREQEGMMLQKATLKVEN